MRGAKFERDVWGKFLKPRVEVLHHTARGGGGLEADRVVTFQRYLDRHIVCREWGDVERRGD